MRALLLLPSQHLAVTIPTAMALGLAAGLVIDTTALTRYVLVAAVLMIYPSMIGFKVGEVASLSHARLVFTSLAVNFLLVPLLAYLLGTALLRSEPQLFAGLAVASLLPTSNLTIALTNLAGGNVPASVKLTVLSLVLGSLLAPWYLLIMVGQSIPVDVWAVFQTIAIVVFLPLTAGVITYSLLLRKYTQDQFRHRVKPYLVAATPYGMMYIMFTGMSVNSQRIVSNPDLILVAVLAQVVFLAINYAMAVAIGRRFFDRRDAVSLVFATALRNLAISIGLAAAAFGPKAAMMVAVAFMFQAQSGAWFVRLERRWQIAGKHVGSKTETRRHEEHQEARRIF